MAYLPTTADRFNFNGRTALIFGGAKGIGGAISQEFARRGARVAVADIDNAAAAETVATIKESGGLATAITCDVSTDESVRDSIAAAETQLGEVDILVNNVGVVLAGNPEDIPLAEWERVFNLNFFSAIRSQTILMPKMLARGSGYIANTASFAGLYPYAVSRAPYVASKAAMIGMTQSLALYLVPKGIRVSCLLPGPVMSGIMGGIKQWSDNAVLTGPGKHLKLITAEQAATIFTDGMEAGRVLIPTHEEGLDILREHAAAPDAFLHGKIADFAQGEFGLPDID